VRVFNPHKIPMLKPDVSHVNALQVVPFFKDDEQKAELSSYVAKADDISSELAAFEFWKFLFAFMVKCCKEDLAHTALLSCCRKGVLPSELGIW